MQNWNALKTEQKLQRKAGEQSGGILVGFLAEFWSEMAAMWGPAIFLIFIFFTGLINYLLTHFLRIIYFNHFKLIFME